MLYNTVVLLLAHGMAGGLQSGRTRVSLAFVVVLSTVVFRRRGPYVRDAIAAIEEGERRGCKDLSRGSFIERPTSGQLHGLHMVIFWRFIFIVVVSVGPGLGCLLQARLLLLQGLCRTGDFPHETREPYMYRACFFKSTKGQSFLWAEAWPTAETGRAPVTGPPLV